MDAHSAVSIGAAELRRAIDLVQERYQTGLDNLKLPNDKIGQLIRLVLTPSGSSELLASDMAARQQSGEVFIGELLTFFERNRNRHDHTYMGTFAWDLGISSLRRPRLSIRALRGRVDKIMRRHKLHGVYFIEPEIILAVPGQRFPRVHAHVHMVCWQKQVPLQIRKLARAIMLTHDLPNELGARAVVFTRKKCAPAEIARLGAYLTKVPACVKQVRPRRNKRGNRLTHEQAKFSPTLVVRMIEILSKLTIYECVGGVGDGKEITRAWRAKLYAWAKEREKQYLTTRSRVGRAVVTLAESKATWRELRTEGLLNSKAVKVQR